VLVSFENQTGWVSSGLITFQRGNIDTVTQFDASGNAIPATQAPTAQPPNQATAQPATTEESP
jgi:hypothetical protein